MSGLIQQTQITDQLLKLSLMNENSITWSYLHMFERKCQLKLMLCLAGCQNHLTDPSQE